MWNTGDKKMPPYGETVMYKLVWGKKIKEGICYLDKTNGEGHHFEIVAKMLQSKDNQPHFLFMENERFLLEVSDVKLFIWYDMIPLNRAGISQVELIRQPNED